MIVLSSAVLCRGPQVLLDQVDLVIHAGQKTGIIGRNGSGKTSLLACLQGSLALDAGELQKPERLRMAWMQQELLNTDRSAQEFVIDGHGEFRRLETELLAAEARHDDLEITRLHGELDNLQSYNIVSQAQQLLSGLGFSSQEFTQPVKAFSGGWRIRLNLAATLMCPSDLLMLDEPTNHLDLEATVWLEQWLSRYQGTLLIISHDRDFLDRVIDGVVSLENRQLIFYRGNFSAYERQRAARLALQQAMFTKQQRRRDEIESFVRRFRYKASKARQAQSRLKELQRMEEIAVAHVDSPFRFSFPEPKQQPEFLLSLQQLSFGFERPLVSGINLTVRSSTRLGLLGVNGCGKSTLLKVIAGQLTPLSGEMTTARGLKVGYFAQHQVDVMDLQSSPLRMLEIRRPGVREQEVRDYLGGFDFHGDRVKEPIVNFSGGEKARLALAAVCWDTPNLLLLDEPTNHLDLEMRHALTLALQQFTGAVILVSHDRHLLNNTVDEFCLIQQGRLGEYAGDLADYEKSLIKSSAGADAAALKRSAAATEMQGNKKQRRQSAAAQREQLAPLRRDLQKLERQMSEMQKLAQELHTLLAAPELYQESQKARLQQLLQQQGELKGRMAAAEEQWLALSLQLEQSGTE